MYATGFGKSAPPVSDGVPAPTPPATVPTPTAYLKLKNHATSSAQVTFAGKAPQFVGLDQINIKLPASLPGTTGVNNYLLTLCYDATNCSNAVTLPVYLATASSGDGLGGGIPITTANPTVRFISITPADATVITRGKAAGIKWNVTGVPGETYTRMYTAITLKQGTKTKAAVSSIARTALGDNSYMWKVPIRSTIAPGSYTLQITTRFTQVTRKLKIVTTVSPPFAIQ